MQLRRLFLPFAAICFILEAAAQPSLTYAVHSPDIGDRCFSMMADTSGVTTGPSGAGVTWDFTGLSATGDTLTQDYVAVSSTPYAASFPSAALALKSSDGSYAYYTLSPSALQMTGAVSGAGAIIPYSDPEKIYEFPFTYGNSFNDNMSAVYTSGVLFYRQGTATCTADGYGTLLLPNGTYSNVLRVQFVQNIVDSADVMGTPFIVTTYSVSHIWFDAALKFPLLNMFAMTVTMSGIPTDFKGVFYYLSGTSGVEEKNMPGIGTVLYPNPAADELNVSFNLPYVSEITADLLTGDGKLVGGVPAGQPGYGTYVLPVNLNGLSSGTYFIRLRSGEGSILKPFIKR